MELIRIYLRDVWISGLGHLAWGLYKLGAHVTCTDTPDGDLSALAARVQSWLAEEEKSADSAGIGNEGRGSIRVQELTWGQQHWGVSPISTESVDYDVLILAEVFSLPELHEELVWTVQKLCHANIEIWSIFLNRSFSFMFFALLADAGGFRVRQIPGDEFDLLGMEGDELGIFMHQTFYDPLSPRVTRN